MGNMRVTKKNLILNYLYDNGWAWSAQLAQKLGISYTYTRVALYELFRRRFVERFREKRRGQVGSMPYIYRLTKNGRKKVEYLRSKGYFGA